MEKKVNDLAIMDKELDTLQNQLEVLKEVAKEYPTLSLRNVIQQMEQRQKEIIKQRDARRARELNDIPQFKEYIKRI